MVGEERARGARREREGQDLSREATVGFRQSVSFVQTKVRLLYTTEICPAFWLGAAGGIPVYVPVPFSLFLSLRRSHSLPRRQFDILRGAPHNTTRIHERQPALLADRAPA